MIDVISHKAIDSHPRSIAKALSWRALGSIDTFVLSWIITGNFIWAGSIASLEVVTKMILYYLHERGWSHIKWGLQRVTVTNESLAARSASTVVPAEVGRASPPIEVTTEIPVAMMANPRRRRVA